MATGLSVSRLVRATINLSPVAAARRGFGTLLVAGDSDIIDTRERVRSYTTLESVAAEFGLNAPEYAAAALYFGQSPHPLTLMIGRWASADTSAILYGGTLSSVEQTIGTWNAITTGSFKITIDGTERTITGLNFSAATTMTGVAAIINTGLSTYGGCTWDGNSFVITSDTAGTGSTLGYASAAGSGSDISALIKCTSSTAASASIAGIDAETPAECALILANISAVWFGLAFAATEAITDQEYIDVAALIEGLDLKRILAITTQDEDCLDSTVTNDIMSELKTLAYKRTWTQYSSSSAYAAVSAVSRAFSVNFAANRSTITLMYKTEPGVAAEVLTETQAATLKDKRGNVFVEYVNDTAIIQYGAMASGHYFDEIHGLSWFEDTVQNNVYNLLYQSKTKIPQTDPGQNQIVAAVASACKEAVNNGLIAPGQWNADGFGQLSNGDFLPDGYYIYTPPMALQAQATREQRIAPPIQVAIKLAGAIQECDILVDVNR
jgi:hypothetical protein